MYEFQINTQPLIFSKVSKFTSTYITIRKQFLGEQKKLLPWEKTIDTISGSLHP